MNPFWDVYLTLTIFSLIAVWFDKKDISWISYASALILLIIFATVRGVGVGSDDLAYMEMLEDISLLWGGNATIHYEYATYNVEVGFFFLLLIISFLSTNSFLLFGVISAVSVFLNLYVYKKMSPILMGSILVYFSHLYLAKEMNAMRLALASAVLMYAAYLLKKRHYTWVSLAIFLASSFHVSAVLFILPAILFMLRLSRSMYMILFALSLVIYASDVINWLPTIVNGFGFGFISTKLELYANAESYNYSLGLFNLVNVRNMLLLLLSLLLWEKLSVRFEYFNLVFVFFFSATVIRIVFGDFAILAGRLYAVVSGFDAILIAMVLCLLVGRAIGLFIMVGYAGITLYLNLEVTNMSGVGRYFW